MDTLSQATFADRVGERLEAQDPDGAAVALTVDRVEDYSGPQGERFSVFLLGPSARMLQQGTYAVDVAGDEPTAVFLVPIASRGDQIECEAAFNRVEVDPPR